MDTANNGASATVTIRELMTKALDPDPNKKLEAVIQAANLYKRHYGNAKNRQDVCAVFASLCMCSDPNIRNETAKQFINFVDAIHRKDVNLLHNAYLNLNKAFEDSVDLRKTLERAEAMLHKLCTNSNATNNDGNGSEVAEMHMTRPELHTRAENTSTRNRKAPKKMSNSKDGTVTEIALNPNARHKIRCEGCNKRIALSSFEKHSDLCNNSTFDRSSSPTLPSLPSVSSSLSLEPSTTKSFAVCPSTQNKRNSLPKCANSTVIRPSLPTLPSVSSLLSIKPRTTKRVKSDDCLSTQIKRKSLPKSLSEYVPIMDVLSIKAEPVEDAKQSTKLTMEKLSKAVTLYKKEADRTTIEGAIALANIQASSTLQIRRNVPEMLPSDHDDDDDDNDLLMIPEESPPVIDLI